MALLLPRGPSSGNRVSGSIKIVNSGRRHGFANSMYTTHVTARLLQNAAPLRRLLRLLQNTIMADYTFISSPSLPHLNFPSYAADDYDVMPITITVESDISTDIEDPPVSPVSPTQQSLDPGLLSPPSTSRASRSAASGKSSHRKRSSSVPPDPRTGADGYNDNRRLVSPSTPNLLVGQQPLQIDIALPPPPLCEYMLFDQQ